MKTISFLLLLIFYSFTANSQQLATINIGKIIDSHNEYNFFLKDLENKKKLYDEIVKNKETNIKKDEVNIENNKLILSENQLNDKINVLNQKYQDLRAYIEKYNYYIDYNIKYNKNILINKIIQIVEKTLIDKNIDIVFSENNYFISNENLDITNEILKKINLEKIDFKILEEDKVFDN